MYVFVVATSWQTIGYSNGIRKKTANDWQDHKFVTSGCSLVRFDFIEDQWKNQLLHLLIGALGIETLPT